MKHHHWTMFLASLCVLANARSSPSAAPVEPSAAAAPLGPWSTGAGEFGPLQSLFLPPGDHVIDLNQEGHYDALAWVVILEYSNFTVASGATLRFVNHESGAPVVLRATGTVRIDGVIDLDGAPGHRADESPTHAEPGPGGFRGGIGSQAGLLNRSSGFGPGAGGFTDAPTPPGRAGGSYATAGRRQGFINALLGELYGTKDLRRLIGGSGGSASAPGLEAGYGGGAGGGAILIGSDTSIVVNGRISARGGRGFGGAGSGSGGAIRLASPSVTWSAGSGEAVLIATGAGCASETAGGHGRIRVEAENFDQGNYLPTMPAGSQVCSLSPFLPPVAASVELDAWLDPASDEWRSVPSDPNAELLGTSDSDLPIGVSGSLTIRLKTVGVLPGSILQARVVGAEGATRVFETIAQAPEAGEDFALTEMTVDVPFGLGAIQFLAER